VRLEHARALASTNGFVGFLDLRAGTSTDDEHVARPFVFASITRPVGDVTVLVARQSSLGLLGRRGPSLRDVAVEEHPPVKAGLGGASPRRLGLLA